jgi:predicted 3-demethylubiquinone-9 3-methyltransferase (glyoxalase superfamily)
MPTLNHMLWFNGQAEEAVNLYTNLFENSKIHNVFNKPAGEPEEVLTKAVGRNSEKVLDRIGRLLVLLTLSKAHISHT